MKSILTSKQRECVERAAKQGAEFYRERSMSGDSLTLRARMRSASSNLMAIHCRTWILFSVRIHMLEDGQDDPKDLERYEAKSLEAEKIKASGGAQEEE